MTENWLVIDLRFNVCSIGLLSFSSEGEIRWEPRLSETYFDPSTSPHSKDEITLSFFRKKGEKFWNPIEAEILEELPDTYEVIDSLFNPQKTIEINQFQQIMSILLKTPLSEFKDIPLLFLVDTKHASNLMGSIRGKINRKNEIKLLTSEAEEYTGYALLETTNGSLPDGNEKFKCQIGRETEERRTIIYTWMGIGFRQEDVLSSDQLEISYWDSIDELERVGAAMFALLWQSHLEERIHVDMRSLAEQINAKKEMLERMHKLLLRLDVVLNNQGSTI